MLSNCCHILQELPLNNRIDSVSNPGFPEPETRDFYYSKPDFFQLPNPGILKTLELLLHSNIRNSDNTEVADWGV